MRSKVQKNRFSLYISDEALDMARQWYAADNCTSMSEYILMSRRRKTRNIRRTSILRRASILLGWSITH